MDPESLSQHGDGESVVSSMSPKTFDRNSQGASVDTVKVVCRVRPFNSREQQLSSGAPLRSVVAMTANSTLLLDPDNDFCPKEMFHFDGNLWSVEGFDSAAEFADQQQVFEAIGVPTLSHILGGWHSCVFAYGQTGSGKTYTMSGGITPDSEGLIPRMCRSLFDEVNSSSTTTVRITATFYEIYNEHVRDLIAKVEDSDTENLKVRNIPGIGPSVVGLTETLVSSWSDCNRLLDLGNARRSVASTKMNDRSSRSHSIFSLTVQQQRTVGENVGSARAVITRSARLNLVDLAGSERNKKTGAEGLRLREAAAINLSLTTLKNVIDALVEQRSVIPYRESRMTWLLSESLGGNSRTVMVVCVSPHADNLEETLNSLRYASRAQGIVCHARVNEDTESRRLELLQNQMAKLQREIGSSLREQVDTMNQRLTQLHSRRVELSLHCQWLEHVHGAATTCVDDENTMKLQASYARAMSQQLNLRISARFAREIDALRFSGEIEEQHLLRLGSTKDDLNSRLRKLQKELQLLIRRLEAGIAAKLDTERKHTELTDSIVKVRARSSRIRDVIEQLLPKKVVARFVAVGLEAIETARCKRQVNENTTRLDKARRSLVEAVIDASECSAVESRMRQQHLTIDNAALRDQVRQARQFMEFERARLGRRMSKLHEEVAFVDRETRLSDDDATRKLAKLDAEWTLKCDLAAEGLLRESRARMTRATDRRLADSSDAELKLAVLESEMKDRLCSTTVDGRRRLEASQVEFRNRVRLVCANHAAIHADVEDDNLNMSLYCDASETSRYGALWETIRQVTPLCDDTEKLLTLAIGPRLRSETPIRFVVDRRIAHR